VKDDVRRVILLPGPVKTHSFGGKPMEHDWRFDVPSGIYRAVTGHKHADITVYIRGTKPRPADRKQVEAWLKDLGSDIFKTRDHANQQLVKLGNDAKPFLREALKTERALEARRRIETLLDRLHDLDITDLEIPKGITVVTAE